MNDTVVVLGGAALIFWWLSSGTSQHRSLEIKFDKIMHITDNYMGSTSVTLEKSFFHNELKQVRKKLIKFMEVTNDFENISQRQFEIHIHYELPVFAKHLTSFQASLEQLIKNFSETGFLADGPFQFTTSDDFLEIEEFVHLTFEFIAMWSEMGYQIAQTMGFSETKIESWTAALRRELPK